MKLEVVIALFINRWYICYSSTPWQFYSLSSPILSSSVTLCCFATNRSVQSEADEIRGPRAGATQGAHPGTGGTRQVGHLQHICIQRQSGGQESHCGWQRPDCEHWGYSGLSTSVEFILKPYSSFSAVIHFRYVMMSLCKPADLDSVYLQLSRGPLCHSMIYLLM